jgi:hypothetical protein
VLTDFHSIPCFRFGRLVCRFARTRRQFVNKQTPTFGTASPGIDFGAEARMYRAWRDRESENLLLPKGVRKFARSRCCHAIAARKMPLFLHGRHPMNTTPKTGNKELADDRRAEYGALRAEILYSDQACMIITGALLSGSVAMLTFALDKGQPVLAVLLSPVWLVGYLYMTEKRSVIETIATYMRECIETEQTGFGWEKWLRDQNQVRGRFRRVFPYVIETIMSFAATLLIPLFISWRFQWRFAWSALLSSLFIPTMLFLEYCNYQKYRKRTEGS